MSGKKLKINIISGCQMSFYLIPSVRWAVLLFSSFCSISGYLISKNEDEGTRETVFLVNGVIQHFSGIQQLLLQF